MYIVYMERIVTAKKDLRKSQGVMQSADATPNINNFSSNRRYLNSTIQRSKRNSLIDPTGCT